MIRLFGFIILVGLFCGAILISPGASLGAFIDYPSLILVVGGTLALLLITHGPAPWGLYLSMITSGAESLTDEERQEISDFFATGSRAALACGLVGQLIGLIIMFGNMDDMGATPSAMAVSMLAVLYGIMLSEFVFQPLRMSIMRKPSPGRRNPPPRVGLYLVFIVEMLMVAQLSLMIVACGDPAAEYQQLAEELRSQFDQTQP
ncbi:MAG: MotA/TolQ/ExbB proton channel family protein [Candidatus Nealsonbacteria bacterium]|nr:MotA/TolQ/ExbB proton channel family protein [Candidatus Nealsonbacteria bacterium]